MSERSHRVSLGKSPKRDNYVITPDSYITSGNHQSQAGNDRGALAAYDLAVRCDPGYARAYNYRGSFKYARLGDILGAIADCDAAIHLDPNYAIAYANRGLLRYSNRQGG
ncbi:MAG: hypothetical protein LH613_13100 [Chamaesiphon sp.]|nr:hypothetical protein [Chamaesiphon sp.]